MYVVFNLQCTGNDSDNTQQIISSVIPPTASPDRGHAVDFDYPDLLFEPGISFNLSWSPQLIIPFEDPNTYVVDIVLYEYDEMSNIWKEIETLAADVPNSGERSVTIIADNSCLSNHGVNAGVCQVAIQVAVGRATGDSSSIAKRQVKFFEGIGLWSGIAYMALSSELRERCEAWSESQPANVGREILDRLPPCPPTVQRAVEDSRFEEERLSSVIYVTMFDVQWRSFFHEGAASCFRQTAFVRYISYYHNTLHGCSHGFPVTTIVHVQIYICIYTHTHTFRIVKTVSQVSNVAIILMASCSRGLLMGVPLTLWHLK